MLNNERKFPKREPVWKPLFDIFLLSLFFSPKKYQAGEAAHAENRPRRCPSRPGKFSLRSALENNTGRTASYNALRALAGTHPLSYYSARPGKSRHAKFIAPKDE